MANFISEQQLSLGCLKIITIKKNKTTKLLDLVQGAKLLGFVKSFLATLPGPTL